MTHAEFRSGYVSGAIKIEIDPNAAAQYLSARWLLPFVTLPVLGVGVAFALSGWIWTGLTVLAAGIVTPRLIKRSAPRFVLTHALENERTYRDVTETNVFRIASVA